MTCLYARRKKEHRLRRGHTGGGSNYIYNIIYIYIYIYVYCIIGSLGKTQEEVIIHIHK